LAQGLDTVQEAVALTPSDEFVKLLERTQAEARELRDDLEATVPLDLGGERFQAHATGARGGFRWRLENDDLMLLIGSPKRDWTISIRYSSAGLWEHGLEALRVRAFQALSAYTTQRDPDCIRVSRADYCFDFWSPSFSAEFLPGLARNVVCHSSSKAHEAGGYNLWGRGGQGETLTIGSKSGLQVQLYNKTLEIDEVSGKTWLYDVWVAGLDGEWVWDTQKPRDVWRLECRFAGDFLKERNIRRPHEIAALMPELIAEALYTRRLATPEGDDSNRRRWPMHPLFSEAVRLRAAAHLLPIGRRVTGRRVALLERAQASLAGNLRTVSVLENGKYDPASVEAFVERAIARIEDDPRHLKKERVAVTRYSDVEDAK
jgi:hypothetical protein